MTDEPGKSDTPSKEASENSGDKKDLNSLLADWDNPEKAKAAPETDELKALKDQVKSLQELEGQRSYDSEMKSFIVPTIKGDLEVSEDYIEYWVNKQADGDPRLIKLFNERSERKADFRKAIEAMAPEFKKHAESEGMVAQKGLANAVKAARESDSTPSGMDNVDFGSLSDQEFALKKAEVFRLAEAGKL